MYILYILLSRKLGKFYIGVASDLERRLQAHNAGQQRWTKRGVPWDLFWKSEFENKTQALKAERKLKKIRNPNYLKEIVRDRRIYPLVSPDWSG